MPTCGSCHVSAVAVADTASAVRDLGFAGAFSVAAASALAIGYKRRLSHAPVAYSAAGDADADQTNKPTDSGLTNRAPGHL